MRFFASFLRRKVQYKLHALRRIGKFLTMEKAKISSNSFIDSSLTTNRYYGCFVRKLFIRDIVGGGWKNFAKLIMWSLRYMI